MNCPGRTTGKSPFSRGSTGKVPKPLPARTFPALFPFFRLDRIYVRGFHGPTLQASMQGAPWTALSDHVPLIASLRTEWRMAVVRYTSNNRLKLLQNGDGFFP